MRFMMVVALMSAAMFIGCGSGTHGPSEQVQVCERCGAEWAVTSDGEVAPTVEWCFHDGQYCIIGFEMLINSEGMDAEGQQRWLNHCLQCSGCRMASFDPDEWHRIIDAMPRR